MSFFKPFDLIVLSYCLACDFMGIFIIGFPGFKLLMNLAVIIVAHKISWRSLIAIMMIDLPVALAILFPKLLFSVAALYSIINDVVFIFCYYAVILTGAIFLAAAGIKLLNKLVPKRLKRML